MHKNNIQFFNYIPKLTDTTGDFPSLLRVETATRFGGGTLDEADRLDIPVAPLLGRSHVPHILVTLALIV